jgi:hypothetical protein
VGLARDYRDRFFKRREANVMDLQSVVSGSEIRDEELAQIVRGHNQAAGFHRYLGAFEDRAGLVLDCSGDEALFRLRQGGFQ